MNQYFHFSLGPVQSFVAQARRTRDFWAGSFLLSWLSAVAMRAVRAQKGSIVFPLADEGFLAWLEGEGKGSPPRQAIVPNRFKAEVPESFSPGPVIESVERAWRGLTETVWKMDLAPTSGPMQREVWQRQVEGFWEMQWALTPDPGDTSILDRRKAWRTHRWPEEPGAKCMIMEGWQELSGVATPRAGEAIRDFWQTTSKGLAGWKQDFDEDEQVCSLAFVKRRFAHHFAGLEVVMPGGWTLRGWRIEPAVPSVAHLCAARWLEQVVREQSAEYLTELYQGARSAGAEEGERNNRLRCVVQAAMGREEGRELAFQVSALDSDVFFRANLENKRLYEAEKTLRLLRALAKLPTPSPFYAVLMMDGDNLGRNLENASRQRGLTAALQQFTRQVPGLVDQHSGFLVYAGGDDVVAMLPLEDALPCAVALRRCYQQAFEGTEATSTISAAVVFVHLKVPLGRVMIECHHLLDELAKDGCGRDALAVRVLKPGGCAAEWALPWAHALAEDQAHLVIERLAADLARQDEGDGGFSHRFLFKVREIFQWLNPTAGLSDVVLGPEEAVSVLAAELIDSGRSVGLGLDLEEARAQVRPLLAQCRPVRRSGRTAEAPDEPPLALDRVEDGGALLVRFLAQKGVER